MITSGPISLDHKDLIKSCLETIQKPFSEQTFSNIFLFRKAHQYTLFQDTTFFFIRGVSNDKIPYLLPIQHPLDLHYFKEILPQIGAQMIYPLDEAICPNCDEGELSFCSYDSDYIYERQNFHDLKGKMLAKKKNLYAQFADTYDSSFVPLNESNCQDAHLVLDAWYSERQDTYDKDAMYDGIRFFQDLSLLGFLVYVDQNPVGLSYGEIQPPNTFVLHCSKGISHIKGLNAFLQIETARQLPEYISYLNWEQDLGIEGLRQAKYTFQPTLIRRKGRLILQPKIAL